MSEICLVFGTRPEAIKLGPVAAELRALGVQPALVCSGQHTDLLRGTPAESDLAGAASLGLASDGNVARWLTEAERLMTVLWREAPPTVVVVQGDTMTALAGARAAQRLGVPIVHVEAGVRSHAREPWPEEETRVAIARLADWHLAPTSTAYANLVGEGVRANRVLVTGNTVVSALARYAPLAVPSPAEPVTVVTMHRREVQTPELAHAIYTLVRSWSLTKPWMRVVWSVHPGFARMLGPEPEMPPNVSLLGPMPYADFAGLLAHAQVVATDSGGVVEEAATLGVPSVVWRRVNDRPEAVQAHIAVFSGEMDQIERDLEAALQLERRPTAAFGGVEAARLVAQHLAQLLD